MGLGMDVGMGMGRVEGSKQRYMMSARKVSLPLYRVSVAA